MLNPIEIIKSGTEKCIGLDALEERIKAGKKLRVKLGVDPTRPDLTFGHLVVFRKLRQFQELGHTAILLIGDYTAMIGDPSGRSATRPSLTQAEVKQNAKTYLEQALKILDPQKTEVRYNSEWLRPLSFEDALNLSRKMTVAQMLERDDFSKRYAANTPISIVEFLYPLLQGYDSVVLESDVELGGIDQLFNLLVGRALQKDAGQPEQAVVCTPLLIGLDGVKKMSKSLDNYIAFNDSAKDMFGKVMSVSDALMWDYYKLLLGYTDSDIKPLQSHHPMEMKKQLAVQLVTLFHSLEAAAYERQEFESVFSKGNVPEAMPEFSQEQLSTAGKLILADVMALTGLYPSKKEIRRLIEQGAVKVDGQKVEDPQFLIEIQASGVVIQAGKRSFFKIK